MEEKKKAVRETLTEMKNGLYGSDVSIWDVLCAAFLLHLDEMEDALDMIELFTQHLIDRYEDVVTNEEPDMDLGTFTGLLESFLRMHYFPDYVLDVDMYITMVDELDDFKILPERVREFENSRIESAS